MSATLETFHIIRHGVLTPIGLDTTTTNLLLKAGINCYGDSRYWSKNFRAIKMALIPEEAIPPLEESLDKITSFPSVVKIMLSLASGALKHCVPSGHSLAAIPVFLSLSDQKSYQIPLQKQNFNRNVSWE